MNNYKIIFSDFDGTLTFNEGLSPVFFEILNFLESNKTPLVIVTGRSISWGHFLLTHFPYLIDVVVEGGGTIVSKREKYIVEDCLVLEADVLKLKNISDNLLHEFPGLNLSVDSFGRKTDRAIELHDLNDPEVFLKVTNFLKKHQVNFSTSNVHLNFWCGEVSKYKAVKYFLEKRGTSESECLFFGDSINDQAMFKSFSNSVGVANISSVIDKLEYKPSIILKGEENVGPYGVLNYLKKNHRKLS